MSVDLVNSHVLIPHLPEASTPVASERIWNCEVARALDGGEHRLAMRQRPPRRLRWTVDPYDAADQARLHARLLAAKLSGYGAAPFWGRGLRVASSAGATLNLDVAPWSFLEVGDVVLVRGTNPTTPEAWTTDTVATIGATSLVLDSSLPASLTGELYVWPLMFGRFSCDLRTHRTNWHTPVTCELRNLATKPMDPPSEVELITNGGFEDGTGASWTFTSSAAPHGFYIHYDGRAPIWGGLATQNAIDGTYDVFSDVAGPGWSRMYQDFTVPDSLATATLTWQDRILKTAFGDWADGTTEIKVSIRTTADAQLVEAFGTSPGDPYTATGPNSRSLDVTALLQAHLGETLRLQFDVIHGGDYVNYYVDLASILAT